MAPGSKPSISRRAWLVLWWSCWILGSGPVGSLARMANAAEATELPPDVWTAGFLAKIIPYTTWPRQTLTTAGGTLTVGLVGRDPFGGKLGELLSNTRMEGVRSVSVITVTNQATFSRCQVLFVPSEHQAQWLDWRREPAAARAAVLTIGDGATFLASGGVIQLDLTKRNFYFNLRHAESSEVKLDSRRLKFALYVYRTTGAGPEPGAP